MRLLAPTSPGELLDRICILSIKAERLSGKQRTHVLDELAALRAVAESELALDGVEEILADLRQTNLALWDAEDRLRAFERRSQFGRDFIDCARSIYINNDRRYGLKRRINERLGSGLLEQKSYA